MMDDHGMEMFMEQTYSVSLKTFNPVAGHG